MKAKLTNRWIWGLIFCCLITIGTSLFVLAEFVPEQTLTPRVFLPLVRRAESLPPSPPEDKNDVPSYVNYFRAVAGSPAVTFDVVLKDNCYQHAQYMAEENHLTHNQCTDSPWHTASGQICAQHGNAWLGGASSRPYWEPYHSIDCWMRSVGHRLWLLYPTTPTFGYGFYTASNHRAGAALDVLSTFNSGADSDYPHWPVRYPAPGQIDVPATQYPITLNWRYFGPTPTVHTTSVTVVGGGAIAHTVTTELPVNHKGIHIAPETLPAQSHIEVSVSGNYDGETFTYSWSFATE